MVILFSLFSDFQGFTGISIYCMWNHYIFLLWKYLKGNLFFSDSLHVACFIYSACWQNRIIWQNIYLKKTQKLCFYSRALRKLRNWEIFKSNFKKIPGNPCQQPVSPGSGNSNLNRYYYDSLSRSCKSFLYGGTMGNGNNFMSQQLCEVSLSVYMSANLSVY